MQSRHKTKINLNPLRRNYTEGVCFIFVVFKKKKNVISTIGFYRYRGRYQVFFAFREPPRAQKAVITLTTDIPSSVCVELSISC